MKRKLNYLANLIFPAIIFSAITGSLTALVVTLFKFFAKHIISFSESVYGILNNEWWLIFVVLLFIMNAAIIYYKAYSKNPDLMGGGIPSSIGVLRGLFTFKWFSNVIGTFFLSLLSFLIGVPLGNEGPSVQMGTAIGKGSVNILAKKHTVWEKYSMTGGSCAGFSVATGAPLSSLFFAIEEAHGRVSPILIIVSAMSVLFSRIFSEILCPIFNVELSLLPSFDFSSLKSNSLWLSLVVGVVVGLFAALFLKYFKVLRSFFLKISDKIPHLYRILIILVLTVIFGTISINFISTGHHLLHSLFEVNFPILFILALVIVRTSLTLGANINGITGGIFLPLLSIGALVGAAIFEVFSLFNIAGEYRTLIIALSVAACIAGMMRMPFTAVLFAVEVLGFSQNILFAVLVSISAFTVTEIFSVKSINDYVIENKLEKINEGKELVVNEACVKIEENAFAVNKEIRDILWPNGLFVESVEFSDNSRHQNDNFGSLVLRAGDKICVRYTTYDEEKTLSDLYAIVR